MRALVIDDFPTMRKILKNVLKRIHIENTLEAENGKQALEVLKKEEGKDSVVGGVPPSLPALLKMPVRNRGRSPPRYA